MKALLSTVFLCAALLPLQAQFQDPIILESPDAQFQGYFGAGQISSVPDVNGDGVADLVVGAIGAAPSGSPQGAGRVYIFDGATRALLRELRSPNEVNDSNFGAPLIGIGDLNGNTTGDVIVATGSRENRVYTFDGGTGRLIHTIHARGRSISAVPDVTGDGVPDIVRGDGFVNPKKATIYNGKTGALWKDLFPPESATNLYGWSVSGVPDVNADGKGEVVVSDWMASGATGRVYLFDGATGTHLRTLSSGQDDPGDEFGRTVVGLSDVNGDRRGEVAVGASGADKVYIFEGATGNMLSRLRSQSNPPTSNFGWTVAAVPDVTGDLINDVAVGGFPGFGDSTVTNVQIYNGATGTHLAILPGQSDWGGGGSVSGAPDLNEDGLGEVLLAHSHATSSGGLVEAGHVKLFLSISLGDTNPSVTLEGETVTISWQAGIYDRLQSSPDGQNWSDFPELDARTSSAFSEPLGVRGSLSLYRLTRD